MCQVAQFVVGLVGLILYAHLVPTLRPAGSALLAGAGVMTVVIGIAAQGTLGSVFAGVSLLMYKPFRAGDRIQITAPTGVETGVIESVNLGYTVLSTFDNRRIVIPNGQLTTQTTVNLTSVDARHLAAIPVTVGYGSDVPRVRAMMSELVGSHPEAEELTEVVVTALGERGVTLTAYVWAADSNAAKRLERSVYEDVIARIEQSADDLVAYPTVRVVR